VHLQLIAYRAILIERNYNSHIERVFRSRANHRWATDIDLFNRLFTCDAFALNRLGKWIEVYDYEIDRLNAVLLHCREMIRIVSNRQQTAVHTRMQRLYAP